MPSAADAAAARTASSVHASRDTLAVVDATTFDEPSTKRAAAALDKWGAQRPTLVVLGTEEAAAAPAKHIADVGWVGQAVAEMAVDRLQLADPALVDDLARPQPLRVGADHEGFLDAHAGAAPLPAYSFKRPLKLAEQIDDDGAMTEEGVSKLVEFVDEALGVAEDKGCEEMLGFATSAVRDSVNSDEVLAHVEERTGVTL